MNELLALGLDLTVVRMVTANAATMLGLDGELGTLGGAAPPTSRSWRLTRARGLCRRTRAPSSVDVWLRPECVIRAGLIVPRSSAFFQVSPPEPEIGRRGRVPRLNRAPNVRPRPGVRGDVTSARTPRRCREAHIGPHPAAAVTLTLGRDGVASKAPSRSRPRRAALSPIGGFGARHGAN